MLAFDNFAETANRFAERNIFALKTGELLRNRKRLREETLNLACARNGQFVLIGKLIHAHYSNDVHKFVVTLQYALNFAGNCIVFIADNFAGEDSAR